MTVFNLDAPIITVKVKAGDRWVIPIQYEIADEGVDVTSLDLSADLAYAKGERLFSFEVDKDLGDPTLGQFGLIASTTDTTGKLGTYYSDVQIITDGEPTTIAALVIQVSAEYTR